MTAGTWNCAAVCSVRFACSWQWKSTAAAISISAVKSWPRCTPAGIFMTLFFAAMGAASAAAHAWIACGVLNAIALVLMMRVMIECSSAMSTVTEVLDHKE